MVAAILLILFSTGVRASYDCYEPTPILETRWAWNLEGTQSVAFQLPTHTYMGPLPTEAQFEVQWNQELAASLKFPQAGDTFALPYSVHRWKLTIHFADRTEVIDRDLTNECTTLPASVYPGEVIRFPQEKLPFSQQDAAFELQVWGR